MKKINFMDNRLCILKINLFPFLFFHLSLQAAVVSTSREATIGAEVISGSIDTCDLNIGPRDCNNNYECNTVSENIPVSSYTYTVGENSYTSNQKLIGGESCQSSAQCLSANCQLGKCTEIGMCGSCVPSGITPTTSTSCCSGLEYNTSTGKCEDAPYVDTPPDEDPGEPTTACTYQLNPENQAYVDQYLDFHTTEMIGYMWLFGGDAEYEDDQIDKLKLVPLDAASFNVDFKDKIKDDKVYRNWPDYYPFYDYATFTKSDLEAGKEQASGKYHASMGVSSPVGVHEVAKQLRKTYAQSYNIFSTQQTEILAALTKTTDATTLGSTQVYNYQLTGEEGAGEAGVDYYQKMIEYFNAMMQMEQTMAQALGTATEQLDKYDQHHFKKLYAMNWDEGNDAGEHMWEPHQCNNDGPDGSKINGGYRQNCIREIMEFEYRKNANDRRDAKNGFFVDPVYRLKGKTIKKIFKDIDTSDRKLTLRYRNIWSDNDNEFITAIKNDIKSQMTSLTTQTASTTTAEGTTNYDNFYTQFIKDEDTTQLWTTIFMQMLSWNGALNISTNESMVDLSSYGIDTSQVKMNNRSDQNQKYNAAGIGGNRKSYPVPFRENFLYFSSNGNSGGLLYSLNQLENFYLESIAAKQETINCLQSKITSLSTNGGSDISGASGATTYTNQSGTQASAGGSLTKDCPPGQPGCGQSAEGLKALNLNLGTSAITGKSKSNRESLGSKGNAAGSLSSSGLMQNAIRASAQQNATVAKTYGQQSLNSAKQNIGSKNMIAAIKKMTAYELSQMGSSNLKNNVVTIANSLSTPTAETTSDLGQIGSGKGTNEKSGQKWKAGNYGLNGELSETNSQVVPALSGVSESELDSMLSASNSSKYNISEDDELFAIISKRYVRSGFPALFKRKTNIESVQKAIESKSPAASGSGKKEVYEPWKNFKPSSQ